MVTTVVERSGLNWISPSEMSDLLPKSVLYVLSPSNGSHLLKTK